MTRIDFYILPDAEPSARHLFACRLVQKARKNGHRIYVHCDSQANAEAFDNALWDFNAQSFLPHKLIGSGGAECPVEIGYGDDPGDHHDILINLGLATPAFFSRFERVAEVVIQQDEILNATRQSYKNYASKNYPLHRHDMRQQQA